MFVSQFFEQLTEPVEAAISCKTDGIRGQAEAGRDRRIARKRILKKECLDDLLATLGQLVDPQPDHLFLVQPAHQAFRRVIGQLIRFHYFDFRRAGSNALPEAIAFPHRNSNQPCLQTVDISKKVQFLKAVQPNGLKNFHRVFAGKAPFERYRINEPLVTVHEGLPRVPIPVQTRLNQFGIAFVAHVAICLMPWPAVADMKVEVFRMRFVRVQYDAYNRQFKLMDRELSSQIEDGGTYLVADLSPESFIPANEQDLLEADHTPA